MRKNLSTIILILIFLVGLSVMLYPSVSDAVNRKHQSRAVAGYAEEVEQLSDADYQTYFDAADAYNRQLNTTPNAFYKPDLVSGYAQTLDISGTGIMGYITIPKISVELPIYHGTDEGVLQVAAGHLEGSSLPVGGAGTHAVISAHRGLPSGIAVFGDLKAGLYLIVQKQAAEGYDAIQPFLVTVPIMENGQYVYDVNAHPKVGTASRKTTQTPPTQEVLSALPQTGQLNWPVPVLAVTGAVLVAAGVVLKKRSGQNEK